MIKENLDLKHYDFRLTKEQIDSLGNVFKSLLENNRKSDPYYQTNKAQIGLFWQQYLVAGILEGTAILRDQKTRTTRKRYNFLKKIKGFLSYYPNESEIYEIFSNCNNQDESLIRLIIEDVKRLEQPPPTNRRRSSIEVLEEKIKKLRTKSKYKS